MIDRSAKTRRAQILCAAINVISTRGGDLTRMKDIADEAKVSIGMIQHYFRTRDELMEQAFYAMMGLSLRSWQDLEGRPVDPLIRLIAGIRYHVYGTIKFEGRWGFWIEFWSLSQRGTFQRQQLAHVLYQQWEKPFRQAIQQLLEEQRIQLQLSVETVVLTLLSLVDGLAIRRTVDPTELSDEAMYEEMLQLTSLLLNISYEEAHQAGEDAAELLAHNISALTLNPDTLKAGVAAWDESVAAEMLVHQSA